MSTVLIRDATIEDVPALTSLMAELGYPDSEGEVRKKFEILSQSPDHKIFVAERSEKIVGFLSFHILCILYGDGMMGRITALVVTESERGKGTGKLLTAKAEEFAKESGLKKIELTSNNRRVEAHKFYESLGFKGNSTRFIKSL